VNPEGLQVLECAKVYGGVRPILDKLPSAPGVYAWFKTFLPPDPASSSGAEFCDYLVTQTSLPHFLSRKSGIPPLYAITLESKRSFSRQKLPTLRALCEQEAFRELVARLLTTHSILFQQPLYIGKADSLRSRIADHLHRRTDLQQRLEKIGVPLLQCTLVFLETPAFSDIDSNLSFEELLSKLFYPPFTARYG
jgi:hypothetical protein